ncbi:helix-turn-helix transcriptional regulator [Plantactinospora sp. WMMB782]|uniref:helix-turn-helix transcriptional regulator n=1 Tax=Plantactinospora sp. WMMB782 TaxID=3404121 RepID=UPI003B961DE2
MAKMPPPDELVGTQEIGILLGTGKSRTKQLIASRSFPEPYVRLAAGGIWLKSDVLAWAKEHRRARPPRGDEDEPG